MIITRALYGLKSAGAAFRSFLTITLDDMNFKPSRADPDAWIRPAIKLDNEKYYEYILVYVDDILAISHNPQQIMDGIQDRFKFKGGKATVPENYLGSKLKFRQINGYGCWTISSYDYVQAAIKNIEEKLQQTSEKLARKAPAPMASGYRPELDLTPELNSSDTQYFQESIGIQRWAIELGRVDILTEVSMLSAYQADPPEGHLGQLLHIVVFLKHHPKLTIYLDLAIPQINPSIFNHNIDPFKENYRGAYEEIPEDIPEPLGRSVVTTAYDDASHAVNKITRRSHTGYILFVNKAPISHYSKRQNTIESSSFSSEFIAMRTCVEAIHLLR